jgi:SOS-response transcriptional repressor LexA
VAAGKKCHSNKVPCHTDLEHTFADFLDNAVDVVRYFKNERFGFSVTYYENNRPRQYYPDFIVLVRAADDREVFWLVETKGELRHNTALMRQAAEAWCERMSGTTHGTWRHLFVQQKKLEKALASGVKTFTDLTKALIVSAERQLRLVPLDSDRAKAEAFKTLLPVYSLKAAAGYFGNGEEVRPEFWIEADGLGQLDEKMFVARAVGRSMEPKIFDGDLLVFRAHPQGTRQGKIVLAQYRGPADPETGGAYTVKRYRSEKTGTPEGGWRHTKVILEPLNREFTPIVLEPEDESAVQIIAEYLTTLARAARA